MAQDLLEDNSVRRTSSRPPNWFIILLLGALSVVTPFAVDMYLPAFSRVAADFGTTTEAISLSLSTFFVGFALGQILYGPLLDRFGRKRPLYVGLCVYILASLACAHPPSIRMLVVFRFIEAIGGCVAQVASVAMVRDFFPADQSAKVFSLIFLIIGLSPLLAPTVGSIVMIWLGWHWIFVLLASIATFTLVMVAWKLPEGHQPDPTVSLRPRPILNGFWQILRNSQFLTFALAGAFSFAGLFAYVAGSPIVFMDGYRVSAKTFGVIFAVLTMGFIGGNQLNVYLLRKSTSRRIFVAALGCQVIIGFVFFAGSRLELFGLVPTMVLFFVFLSCIGLTYPNAAAIALAPFAQNAGRASALLGFIQMGTGAFASTGVGLFGAQIVVALLFGSAAIAAAIFYIGKHRIGAEVFVDTTDASLPVVH